MIALKTPGEIDAIAAAGEILGALHAAMPGQVRPGVSTLELDEFADWDDLG